MSNMPRCGKIIYADATQVHNTMLARRNGCPECGENKLTLSYYYCESCEGYHLTRMNEKKQKAFKKMQYQAWRMREVKK